MDDGCARAYQESNVRGSERDNMEALVMLKALLIAIPLIVSGGVRSETHTAHPEPVVYAFGASACSHCQRASAYLHQLLATTKRFELREYDIVSNTNDATAFARVVGAIGLTDPVVPMIIIGRTVILGFEDVDTTGREIENYLTTCAIHGCPDKIKGILGESDPAVANTSDTWSVQHKWKETSLRP
jgi:glutaredoxin